MPRPLRHLAVSLALLGATFATAVAAPASAAVHVSKSGGAVTIDAGELPASTGGGIPIAVVSFPDFDDMGQPNGFFTLAVDNGGESVQQADFTAGPGCDEEGNRVTCEMTTSV